MNVKQIVRLGVLSIASSLLGCSNAPPQVITDQDELASYLEKHPSPEMPEPSPDDFASP